MPRIHSRDYKVAAIPQHGETMQPWNAMFDRLLRYKSEHGDCLVPRNYPKDSKLGRWVNKQRSHRDKLSVERKEKLAAIGFVFVVQRHDDFETMLKKLVEYKERHGNCLVPQKYKEDRKLGKWVDNQRTFQRNGQLSPERKATLDNAGFVWKVTKTWDEMFQRLVEYKREYGHCLVPQSFPRLGNWVRLQRVRKSSRSPEQKRKLRSIGFVWNARKEHWKDAYSPRENRMSNNFPTCCDDVGDK